MPPNIPFHRMVRQYLAEEEEDEEAFIPQSLPNKQKIAKNCTTLETDHLRERGHQLWQNLLKHGQAPVDVDARNPQDYEDEDLERALQSILVMSDDESSSSTRCTDFLKAHGGHVHALPKEILDGIHCRAPAKFHAQVADFNDNLWYDMRPLAAGEETPERNASNGLEHWGLHTTPLTANESLGSFLSTEHTVAQPAHVDYTWEILEEEGKSLEIAFFPLTEEGMFLQIWVRDDGSTETIEGTLVFVPYGKILVVPASTIHGGGFRTTPSGPIGNLRFHLYLAQGTSRLPVHQTNKYTQPHNPTKELSQKYVVSPEVSVLLDSLFV